MTDFPIEEALARLQKEVADYRVPVVDLIAVQTRDPFKVLVTTILSARTRDEVTAKAAARLFARAGDGASLARLSIAEIEQCIRPVGFFRNKARYLSQLPLALERLYQGRIPETVDELLRLPGVGRKTANLVVVVAFGRPAVCVDTHVHRIMNIWGYVHTRTPEQTEKALRQHLPRKYWLTFNSILVAFGQGTCRPRLPHCDRCVLGDLCPRLGVRPRRPPQARQSSGTDEKFLVSWNVNGLRAALGKGFLDSFHELAPDVLALQEIKAHPDQLPDTVRHIPGYHAFWYPAQKKGYSGTAVFSRRQPLQVLYGLENKAFDDEGRVLTCEFADFFLVNCYFPNAQPELRRLEYKLAFDQALELWLDRLSRTKSVVLCGDLNVAHTELDLARPAANVGKPGFSNEERHWLDSLLRAGYVDTFRWLHPEAEQYSWWSYRGGARARNVGWRIDYFLVDPGSRDRVVRAAIHDDILGSDHCPVSLVWR